MRLKACVSQQRRGYVGDLLPRISGLCQVARRRGQAPVGPFGEAACTRNPVGGRRSAAGLWLQVEDPVPQAPPPRGVFVLRRRTRTRGGCFGFRVWHHGPLLSEASPATGLRTRQLRGWAFSDHAHVHFPPLGSLGVPRGCGGRRGRKGHSCQEAGGRPAGRLCLGCVQECGPRPGGPVTAAFPQTVPRPRGQLSSGGGSPPPWSALPCPAGERGFGEKGTVRPPTPRGPTPSRRPAHQHM